MINLICFEEWLGLNNPAIPAEVWHITPYAGSSAGFCHHLHIARGTQR